ncbi:glucuronosyltransferase PGSIP8 [Olea europaea subsp. europaea]|uniref:Glucuronosyltransferase PGSIP8 n=1 Tax=Olea europaea subsp. europaea TaxID=158383 RepID=A0A8S0VM67_OLEEU|nr:glucuronosyltransferase PGSIP8 [Olea europaea subsp. europaea]
MGERRLLSCLIFLVLNIVCEGKGMHRNAYATMMYMGTPRDYEFYIATRVMLRSLVKLKANADLVVIASMDVPDQWVQAL